MAPACNELQTPPAAHTEECPSGVEGIIKIPCFSSRPVFILKTPVCEYLCVSIWSCSVPTGSCPNLVMSKSEAHEENHGDVVSIAVQPSRTHRSLCLVPSAEEDHRSSKLASQDWQSGLQVQVSLYGVFVPVPGEQDGWAFGLVMCKVFRAFGVSECFRGQSQLPARVSLLMQLESRVSVVSPVLSFFCRWKKLSMEGQPTGRGPWDGHPILVPSDRVPPLLLPCLVQLTPLPRPSSPAASPSSHHRHRAPSLIPDPCLMPTLRNPSGGAGRRTCILRSPPV